MPEIIVRQSGPLVGRVRIDGAKNAVLPIMAATLLVDGKSVIEDVPQLRDVYVMIDLLKTLGADVEFENGILQVDASGVDKWDAPYELVRKMRASFLVMGPILARFKRTRVSMPGGCAIGTRPIDLHLKGFEALGADVSVEHGTVEASCSALSGDKIYLDFPSVGATENIIMAASMAEGTTILENAAEEPEIVDLANFLNRMGANVKGAGTNTITIKGVSALKGVTHRVIPDRIEAGTFMVAAAITKGDIEIENVVIEHLKPAIAKLKEVGCTIIEGDESIRVIGPKETLATTIKTLPHPGFPTDMQAQFMALLSMAKGTSIVTETVFENRFMHVNELRRMGANIRIEGKTAIVQGVDSLEGANVEATDLRAGAALILAGLLAKGETRIGQIHHIERGYVSIEKKITQLGGKIEKVI
ncbi:UDP-N-acetylglucosamine 1-carboxyvinyltransferase [Peptoclostridium litorale DSM 5388]|uniref:UDP-N-acetylglucosamine 1-carboxyvinyltransferase n=1 Tax=Peptoclostridium litorale DSM 5388 TaxID=1121324 RepID=A0A069RCG4_PEPLI|nr:UDP-N-acetylglucosamine 1-carboxyvinyltransferase [Peptoclostridium litorale]KDR94739.1 UDP-N-acetylglucosamine 1-carboxyvinyltransferase 1 [Peptoclostridium litorale DSM 5388]SIN91618.1 UDP-N-acetylglucosamine 1-carboxyvinyltransferase [Peptoclostridium litorale DSM 5388]